MFSPELMRFLMQYQVTEQKPTKKFIKFSDGGILHSKKAVPVLVRSNKF